MFLYSIAALIWGSTWLAIKFQLGTVDPLVSVSYRFLLASIILLLYCKLTKMNLKYTKKEHFFMALEGFLLFGINYWLVYLAETTLPSGLVSIVFSTIIFWNIFNGTLFLKAPIRKRVLFGGIIGISGIIIIFNRELSTFSFSSDNSLAFVFCFLSAYSASLGNIMSAFNQKKGLPVVQVNAFGMLYGALLMLLVSALLRKPFIFDLSFSYTSSLLYLALFGSVIAFWAYLTLLGRIGADKAGYVTLIFPVIALGLSTFFENFQWTITVVIGVFFILFGNLLIIQRKGKK